jgi:hypothetical protein
MSSSGKPGKSKQALAAERQRRLAEQLRANLRKRRALARVRSKADAEAADGTPASGGRGD